MSLTRTRLAGWLMLALIGLQTIQLRAQELSPQLPTDQFAVDLQADAKVLGQIGVAPTPRNYPDFTAKDIDRMFAQTVAAGTAAVFIYQWSNPELGTVPANALAASNQYRLLPILALSPTTLDQQRKELDLPAGLRGEKRSFSNPKIRAAFVQSAEGLARLNPPHLCLGTEINYLALQRLDEFLHFATLYKEAYQAVKNISPDTKVFVSFQYDFIRVLDNKEPDRIADHAKVLDIFRPELDLLAITSYPASFYATPADLPSNYFAHLRNYQRPGDEVIVMEIGWPSGGKSTPTQQRQFVERLPALLAPVSPRLTAWSLLHDVKLDAFGPDLATTGLYTLQDVPKPALAAWQSFRKP